MQSRPDPRALSTGQRMILIQRGLIPSVDPNTTARLRDFTQKKKLRAMLEKQERQKNTDHEQKPTQPEPFSTD